MIFKYFVVAIGAEDRADSSGDLWSWWYWIIWGCKSEVGTI